MFSFLKKSDPACAGSRSSSRTGQPKTGSWAARLKQGSVQHARATWARQLTGLFSGGKIDEDLYEELETILLTADVGVAATQFLLDDLRARVKRDRAGPMPPS